MNMISSALSRRSVSAAVMESSGSNGVPIKLMVRDSANGHSNCVRHGLDEHDEKTWAYLSSPSMCDEVVEADCRPKNWRKHGRLHVVVSAHSTRREDGARAEAEDADSGARQSREVRRDSWTWKALM